MKLKGPEQGRWLGGAQMDITGYLMTVKWVTGVMERLQLWVVGLILGIGLSMPDQCLNNSDQYNILYY